MSKRIGLLLAVALLAGLAGGAGAAERPNVVIFLADDLGWAEVGFHGGPIDNCEYNDLASEHPKVVADLAKRLRDRRLQYPIPGTRVHLVPPPGWRAPKDWATYPIPLDELQGEEAPGYPPSRFIRWVLDRVHRGRGRIIYE